MPMRAHDASRLDNFGGDHLDLLLGHTANIDLNTNRPVNAKLGDHSPRYYIDVLETLEDASNRARIRVGKDLESKLRDC